MEPPNFSTHNCSQFHPYLKNPQSQPLNDDVEEALSLCDMPTGKPATNHPGKQFSDQHQEIDDFDFNDAGFNSPENQMCSADEVFFRGQILPFRHSVSLPSGFTTRTRNAISFSRSESVSLASSRSSESNSPSGSDSTGHKPMTRNQFHSHPSPTPQIRTRSYRRPDPRPSQKWRFLQVGVLDPREIGLSDLKKRRERSKMKDEKQKKTKQILMFGGCECSANEVESEVLSWRIPMVKVKARGLKEEINVGVGGRKHAVASHRTAEWLKQLSI